MISVELNAEMAVTQSWDGSVLQENNKNRLTNPALSKHVNFISEAWYDDMQIPRIFGKPSWGLSLN